MEDLGKGSADSLLLRPTRHLLRDLIHQDQPLLMEGRFTRRNGTGSVQVESAMLLSQARERLTRALHISLVADQIAPDMLQQLKTVCQGYSGRCELVIHLPNGGDVDTAYAAVNTLRLDDLSPHIYRTRDGGATWTHIADGIPDGGPVNVVREDPQRQGLLFAGTERTVYVSFDDGDRWQSLRNDLPPSSVRDLVIKDDDLVVGTHGRGIWILDDITPLRQITAEVTEAPVHLFAPQQAWRFRWNKNTDTPLPPGEPAGQNPPDGAILNYWLGADAAGPVTLEILDQAGEVVRRYSSADEPEAPLGGQNVPAYWPRSPQVLSTEAGLHRFVWDLHYPRPEVLSFGYPIAAIVGNTPVTPVGPWVLPGRYRARLTVDGVTHTQPLLVKMDPRVTTAPAEIERQFRLSRQLVELLRQSREALETVRSRTRADDPVPAETAELARALAGLNGQLARLYRTVENADVGPTSAVVTSVAVRERALGALLQRVLEFQKP